MENNENTINTMEGLTIDDINTLLTGQTEINTVTNSITIQDDADNMDAINLEVSDDIIGYSLSESGDSLTEVVIDDEFVINYFKIQKLVERLSGQLEDAKIIIKRFIEEHDTGSIESNGMAVKYTPSTTTTTLDSTKIKSKYPDIAAECSKVSARKSSISIKESV